MSYADEWLGDSLLTEESMLLDFQELISHYKAMTLESQIVPAREETPLPTLVAVLEPDSQERDRVLTHSFLPMDRETGEFTKFLQFYCELPIDVGGVDRIVLLEALCRLNELLPFGACLSVAPRPELELPQMVGVRTVQGFPIDQPIDRGVFTEDVFLFDMSCELATIILDGLVQGMSLEEAEAQLNL